jgi:hypothetical protein
VTIVPGGAAGTNHAGHFAGSGAYTSTNSAQKGYGAGAIFNVGINTSIKQYCVGVCVFTGVSFWAKADSAVPSPNTDNLTNDINFDFIVPETMGQYCNNTGTMPTGGTCPALADGGPGFMSGGDCSSGCFNHPHVTIHLTTEWQQFSIGFSAASGGTAVVNGVIQELGWLPSTTSSTTESWAFSLDEIAFYSGSMGPTGPVNPNPSSSSGGDAGSTSSSGGDAATTSDAATDH